MNPNPKCIDPAIRKSIMLLNDKEITTSDSCAGIGPSKGYSGRTIGKQHSRHSNPYFTIDNDKSAWDSLQLLINNLAQVHTKVKFCAYPVKLFKVERNQYPGEKDKWEIRMHDFFYLPITYRNSIYSIHSVHSVHSVHSISNPFKYFHASKKRWLVALEKIAEEL